MRIGYFKAMGIGFLVYIVVLFLFVKFGYGANVNLNCRFDWLKHCSHTVPKSAQCTKCMRVAGRNNLLSGKCLRALKSNGYVTKEDMDWYRRNR